MEIYQSNDNGLVLSEIEPFVLQVLQQIPRATDPGTDKGVADRIYQRPVEHSDAEFCEEWVEFVHPDLKHLFQSAVATVQDDLGRAEKSAGVNPPTLIIRHKHFDAWLNALNQARLALCARFGFSESELDSSGPGMITSEKEFALFQIQFYGLIQELILRAMEGDYGIKEEDEDSDESFPENGEA